MILHHASQGLDILQRMKQIRKVMGLEFTDLRKCREVQVCLLYTSRWGVSGPPGKKHSSQRGSVFGSCIESEGKRQIIRLKIFEKTNKRRRRCSIAMKV